jgi:hypothetical protein
MMKETTNQDHYDYFRTVGRRAMGGSVFFVFRQRRGRVQGIIEADLFGQGKFFTPAGS